MRKKYSFKSFVTGDSNGFAYAAALAAAESPGQIYNPLIFTGESGVGKTHLMRAIEQCIQEHEPEKKVKYVTSDTFMGEMIQAIREEQMETFREQYKELDVLLIDDIQFLGGKLSTQAEVMKMVGVFCHAGKQVVFASGDSLENLEVIKEKVLTEMEDGLVAEIGAPDYEMRMQILKKELEQYDLSEAECRILHKYMKEIALQVSGNTGMMKGRLNNEIARLILGR